VDGGGKEIGQIDQRDHGTVDGHRTEQEIDARRLHDTRHCHDVDAILVVADRENDKLGCVGRSRSGLRAWLARNAIQGLRTPELIRTDCAYDHRLAFESSPRNESLDSDVSLDQIY